MSDVDVRPSSIEGLGIFTTRAYCAGEQIVRINVVREITPDAPIRPDVGERIEHCAYPDGKVVLIAFPERHVNHSCDPNAWERFDENVSSLFARRNIAAGEEITIDYNINITNGTAWPCHCGAARCHGVVAGDYFGLPLEWQHEYRPLLANWFVRRNRVRLDELNKEFVRHYYEDVVSTGAVEQVRQFISADYVEVYEHRRYAIGIEGAEEHIRGVRKTYPDLRLIVEQQIAEGEWVVSRVTMHGTHAGEWMGIKPTGKPIEVTAVNIDRVVDGRIVEHGGAANLLEPLLQIGAVKVAT